MNCFTEAAEEKDLVKAVLEEYEVDGTVARQDIGVFLNKLREMGIV